MSDQRVVGKVFLFGNPYHGLRRLSQVDHAGVPGGVSAMTGQIDGPDADRLSGPIQRRRVLRRRGHVPPDLAPALCALPGSVHQKKVRHALPLIVDVNSR